MEKIDKNNCILILINLSISTVVLMCYLFMVVFNISEYNVEMYKKTYMYFFTFQFLTLSIVVCFWKIDKFINKKMYLKYFIEICLLVFSIMPLFLMIFIVGNMNIMNILLPMLLEIIWAISILSFRQVLDTTSLENMWKGLIIVTFILSIMILSLIFAYMYYKYAQLVITTVYDKDIPTIFFINPLVTIVGFIHMEISNYSQMGIKPVICFSVFYILLIVDNLFISYKRTAKYM